MYNFPMMNRVNIQQLSHYFIRQALYEAHPWLRSHIDQLGTVTNTLPSLEPLDRTATVSHPLDPIHEDESSTKGNIEILANILHQQCQLDRDKDSDLWNNKLRLIYGDQKTWARLWAIKRGGSEQELPGYGQMKWLLPVPALFHTKMCYLKVIHRTFWSAKPPVQVDGDISHSSASTANTGRRPKNTSNTKAPKEYAESWSYLKLARDLWKRKRISHEKNNEFYALEEFMIHCFQARIAVSFWERLFKNRGEDVQSIEQEKLHQEVEARALQLDLYAFEAVVEDIRTDLFCSPTPQEEDPEFRNHMQFLQTFEPYLILKLGIKRGDIGYIRIALARMCFYFNGSSSNKYGSLMLWWAHHLASDAVQPALAKALLANSLINTSGQKDGFKEIDIYNEHLNGHIKDTFHARNNSTFDFEYVLQYASLNEPSFQEIKENTNRFFGLIRSGRHFIKSPRDDILMLANKLRAESFKRQPNHASRKTVRPANDLFLIGAESMARKIQNYNDTLPNNDEPSELLDSLASHDEGHDIVPQLDTIPEEPDDEV